MNRSGLTSTLVGAVAAALLHSTGAFAEGGKWDTLNVGPGNGSGQTSASPWISAPAAGSHYAEWNFFTNDAPASPGVFGTDNTPDIGSFGGGSASVTETTGAAFLTGGGNIYSFSGATSFTAVLAGGGTGLQDVYLRIGTLGTLPTATATLNGVAAQKVGTYELITSFMGSPSYEEEWYWKWTVAAASTYTFAFSASGDSLSLDQVALYSTAAAVPEPQTYALFAAGLGLVGFIARRRVRG